MVVIATVYTAESHLQAGEWEKRRGAGLRCEQLSKRPEGFLVVTLTLLSLIPGTVCPRGFVYTSPVWLHDMPGLV